MLKFKARFGLGFILLICALSGSCIIVQTHVKSLDKQKLSLSKTFKIRSATKAHLVDGSVVVFAKGFKLSDETLFGSGLKWNLSRSASHEVTQVPLDSVAALEYYSKRFEGLMFLASLPAATVGAAALAVAIFGSCPTVYSFDGEDYHLEAETFSYSITERFETNDLDRLDYGEVIDGVYSLKVANEALETHYINQLTLLTADHPPSFEAMPNEKHEIVLFGRPNPILRATSKSGNDVLRQIESRDDLWYQSDSATTSELAQQVTQDWIDLEVPKPVNARKMQVGLRLRNTLLNTVLFYDVILRAQGIAAVDWLGSTASNTLYAWRFYKWYKKHFGLRIQVFDGEELWDDVRIGDTGPIAWHVQGAELDVPKGNTARLRLSFLPDNWVIDWVGISFHRSEDVRVAAVACEEATALNGQAIYTLIEKKDDRYLVTHPAESHILNFKVGPVPPGMQRSYFLKSRGYYIEWLRRDWLKTDPNRVAEKFEINDDTITTAAQLWIAKKQPFEKQFYESKISRGGTQQ
jgi:hypothetical protein